MSFLRSDFVRAGGESFALVKSSRRAVIWRVMKGEQIIRFETWEIYLAGYGEKFYEPGEGKTGVFMTLIEAESRFNDINNG